MKRYKSLVLGAGPAGISAALYLARFGLSVALVEKLTPGGLLLQTLEIENYPGFPKGVKGYELADAFNEQLAPYDTITRYTDAVTEMELQASPKRFKIGEEWIEAETVIICAGVKYRKLGLPNEGKLLGKGISHCALCDGHFFRNQPVAVVGGGNSALEESLHLAKLASELYLIHRRDEFRGAPIYQARLKSMPNVNFECSTVITALHGEDQLEGITIQRKRTGEELFLQVNGLFVFIGFEPPSGLFPPQLRLDDHGFVVTDEEMRTNIPGVFAAGDVRSKLCRQVVTAVGDGATAANSAYVYLEHHNG